MEPGRDNHSDAGELVRRLGEQRLPGEVMDDLNAVYASIHPYDLDRRSLCANELLGKYLESCPPASFERALLLLRILEFLYPTAPVADAYFDNLRGLLRGCEPLDREGTVVLGLGTGRCGSTSLAAAFRGVESAIATHETPPLIFWQPQPDQVAFHLRRLRLLSRYFQLVFDASHWWLNVVPAFFEQFPGGRVVGLHRNMEACVNSFLRIKGVERGTVNHWAPPDDTRWARSNWDPCYPSYVPPQAYEDNPFMAKGTQIQWYVDDYNAALRELAEKWPRNVMLIDTDSLGDPQVSSRLSAFVGAGVSIPEPRYNATAMDSMNQQEPFWF